MNQARDGDEQTPLCISAQTGNFEVVKYLVGKGAKIKQMALDAAESSSHPEILQFLTKEAYTQNDLIMKEKYGNRKKI